jgi:hypothetical protein
MNFSPELLLIVSVGVVGVLHTIVPDHWVPITLIARQRGWSMGETARAAFAAGVGHVVSTLMIASVIWFAGVAVAISAMAVVFALATIVTYVALCVYSTAGLQRVSLGPFERYGEVMSGVFVALVGVAFWVWPAM